MTIPRLVWRRSVAGSSQESGTGSANLAAPKQVALIGALGAAIAGLFSVFTVVLTIVLSPSNPSPHSNPAPTAIPGKPPKLPPLPPPEVSLSVLLAPLDSPDPEVRKNG